MLLGQNIAGLGQPGSFLFDLHRAGRGVFQFGCFFLVSWSLSLRKTTHEILLDELLAFALGRYRRRSGRGFHRVGGALHG